MKTLFPLLFIFILTSCSTSWDPPRQGYEIYQTRHTNDEQIKRDMIACGFPDVRDGSPYLNSDPNGYTSSVICMEKKVIAVVLVEVEFAALIFLKKPKPAKSISAKRRGRKIRNEHPCSRSYCRPCAWFDRL